VVQKALYPEGEAVCHAIVVHPPGGIASGDTLELDVSVGAAAHALLTTPGATKWYKSIGMASEQKVTIRVDAGGVLEWLPQENIIFDNAVGSLATRVALAPGGSYLGWEVTSLGRAAANENFATGCFRQSFQLRVQDKLVWLEQGAVDAASSLTRSPIGLAHRRVFGSMLAAGVVLRDDALAALRAIPVPNGASAGISRIDSVLSARFLGESGEAARRYFVMLWGILRPTIASLPAQPPRIWQT
jgi:urease accessory protein